MLFGLLTKGTMTNEEQRMAELVFARDIRDSYDKVSENIDICLQWRDLYSETLLWPISEESWENWQTHRLIIAVWCRVNMSQVFLEKRLQLMYRKNKLLVKKIQMFQTNHAKLAHFLQQNSFPDDNNKYFHLYQALSRDLAMQFDDARDDIVVTQRQCVLRRTPLEIIEEKFSEMQWRIETVLPNVALARDHYDPLYPLGLESKHKIYYACLTIMAQCALVYRTNKEDALYTYYVAFLDLFYFCLGQEQPDMSDKFLVSRFHQSQLRVIDVYYPHDNRAFTCWDLPDLYHVLFHIPLAEEQMAPRVPIEDYIKKSLPFCCQRRTFIENPTKTVQNKKGEGEIVKRLLWCMLANVYPDTQKTFDMRRLLRVWQICSDETLMIEAFERKKYSPGTRATRKVTDAWKTETFKGCEIIINAYRLWVYAMVYKNTQYQKVAAEYLQWDMFIKHTLDICATCQTIDIYGDDVFANVRSRLSTVRLKNNQVQRYKKDDQVMFVLKYLKEALDTHVYPKVYQFHHAKTMLFSEAIELYPWLEVYALSLDELQHSLEFPLPLEMKENILNILVKIPAHERLSAESIGLLQLSQFGGVKRDTLLILLSLLDIYHVSGKPKNMREFIGLFDSVYEIKVITWFLIVISRLSNFHLVPLDAESVKGVHKAFMTKKYQLQQGQTLSPDVYNVFVTICCKHILTNQGTQGFGNHTVYYDAVKNKYMCNKAYKAHTDSDISKPGKKKKQGKPQNKAVQTMRKSFATIPCRNNPVLQINIEGYMLVLGMSRNKIEKYLHCPRCAGFHQYNWKNWSGSSDGRYRCEECIQNEFTTNTPAYRCFHCEAMIPTATAHRRHLEIMSADLPMTEPFRSVYFCDKHYKIAKRYTPNVIETQLAEKIAKSEKRSLLRAAKKY